MIYWICEHPDDREAMCGRYSLVFIDDIGNRFRVFNPMIGSRSRFNIAPGNEMPVVIRKEENELAIMKWGLVPHRVHDEEKVKPSINARAETVYEKPSFRDLIKNQRCLVPASGFFEWKKEGSKRIPFFLHLPESPLFAFAGLYDCRADSRGTLHFSYTIITSEPNALVAKIHDRMPSILLPENEDRWLSKNPLNAAELREILTPFPAENMAMYPVSPRVNRVDADDEQVIRPVISLFSELTL